MPFCQSSDWWGAEGAPRWCSKESLTKALLPLGLNDQEEGSLVLWGQPIRKELPLQKILGAAQIVVPGNGERGRNGSYLSSFPLSNF